jgi:hypothetical protein
LIIKTTTIFQVTTITPLLAKEGVGGGLVDYIITGLSFKVTEPVEATIFKQIFIQKRMFCHIFTLDSPAFQSQFY